MNHQDRIDAFNLAAGVVLAIAILGLFAGLAGGSQADGSAEPTVIRWRAGADTLPPYSGWHVATVQPTEGVHAATSVAEATDAFRWVEHVSGPEACIFTATGHRSAGGAWRPASDVGGGRDCSAHVRDNHCGYFMPGWDVFAASGGACASFGVPPCSGICW